MTSRHFRLALNLSAIFATFLAHAKDTSDGIEKAYTESAGK
jgi:hypothetical protein